MLLKRSCVFLKYTPDTYNHFHTVLYCLLTRTRSYKIFGYNELGYNELVILRSLRVRYNEVFL